MNITGECFCGEVQYQVNGELRDIRSCHCSRCRKAFSAQASAFAEVSPSDFVWLAGEHLLHTYTNKQGFGLQFCRQCGSTLTGTFNDLIHGITLGCLNGNPDITLDKHIFVGSKANWEILPEGGAQFEEHSPK